MSPIPRPASTSPLEGELVRLTALDEETVRTFIAPAFNDPEVQLGLVLPFPQPGQGAIDWFNGWRGLKEDSAHFLIQCLATQEPVGQISIESISPRDCNSEIGLWIAREHWHEGYATDALRVLCRFAFDEMGLHKVWLSVLGSNPRARGVYERVGFQLELTSGDEHMVGGKRVAVHTMGMLGDELVL